VDPRQRASTRAQQLQHLDQALRLVRRFVDSLQQLEGLTMQRRQRTEASLDLLREDLEHLRAPLAEAVPSERAAG